MSSRGVGDLPLLVIDAGRFLDGVGDDFRLLGHRRGEPAFIADVAELIVGVAVRPTLYRTRAPPGRLIRLV